MGVQGLKTYHVDDAAVGELAAVDGHEDAALSASILATFSALSRAFASEVTCRFSRLTLVSCSHVLCACTFAASKRPSFVSLGLVTSPE